MDTALELELLTDCSVQLVKLQYQLAFCRATWSAESSPTAELLCDNTPNERPSFFDPANGCALDSQSHQHANTQLNSAAVSSDTSALGASVDPSASSDQGLENFTFGIHQFSMTVIDSRPSVSRRLLRARRSSSCLPSEDCARGRKCSK